MALSEDLAIYIADFGVPCSKGTTNFKALLDQPDDIVGFGAADMVSRSYAITYVTGVVTLVSGDAVTVNGASFTVRHPPQQLDDGAFTQAVLKK